MAIIKNGKIRGLIGNLVYRVVNGQETVQSAPRKSKTKKPPTELNVQFGNTVRVCTKMYRLIKEFALNALDGRFYRDLVRLLRMNLYSDQSVFDDSRFDTWNYLPDSRRMAISKHLKTEDMFNGHVRANIEDDVCEVRIPHYDPERVSWKLRNRADCMEFAFTLIHYDFENDHAEVIGNYTSERLWTYHQHSARTISVPLKSTSGEDITKGLIAVCFGIRFYAAMDSAGYLNTKEINPTSMVGVWYRRSLVSSE